MDIFGKEIRRKKPRYVRGEQYLPGNVTKLNQTFLGIELVHLLIIVGDS